jgi:hypothetical protein
MRREKANRGYSVVRWRPGDVRTAKKTDPQETHAKVLMSSHCSATAGQCVFLRLTHYESIVVGGLKPPDLLMCLSQFVPRFLKLRGKAVPHPFRPICSCVGGG